MCCIIRYWFTCQHGFRLRRSKCGGTKFKKTRSGPTPACKSEAYLSITIPVKCGPCQYLAFEKHWKRKLSMADLFLEKLKEKNLPGVEEVTALVEQLKDEFNTATWDTRTRFPHIHKDRIIRVNLGQFEKRPSPLCYEVLPEDVPEPPEVVHPNHDGYEYDWDYVASTDPLHPLDVNYAHPLDDVDPSWMLNHLSAEELEQTSSETGFDADEAVNLWAKSPDWFQTDSTEWVEDDEDWTRDASGPESSKHGSRQSPEMQNRHTYASAQIDGSKEQSAVSAVRIEMVLQEFSRLLNNKDRCDEPPERRKMMPNKNLSKGLRPLQISDASSKQNAPQKSLITSPSTPGGRSNDGSCDFPPPTPSLLSDQQPWSPSASSTQITDFATTDLNHAPGNAETSASNSRSATYDKLRRHVGKTKNVDKAKFYKNWLRFSRSEIKDVEGMNGRFVQDPQVPQEANAKNGWWK